MRDCVWRLTIRRLHVDKPKFNGTLAKESTQLLSIIRSGLPLTTFPSADDVHVGSKLFGYILLRPSPRFPFEAQAMVWLFVPGVDLYFHSPPRCQRCTGTDFLLRLYRVNSNFSTYTAATCMRLNLGSLLIGTFWPWFMRNGKVLI